MKIGFLVIDMQTIHLQRVEQKTINRACEYINYVSDMLRSKDHVIIHIQDIEGITESTKEEYNTISEIEMRETDWIVIKEHSNGFWKTGLEQILTDQGAEFIVIAGYAAEHCVLATYNGAVERGFSAVILQHGILSSHPDAVTSAYRDRNMISYPVVKYLMESDR